MAEDNQHAPNLFGLLEDKGFVIHGQPAVQHEKGLIEKTIDFAEEVVDAVSDGFNRTAKDGEGREEGQPSVASQIHIPQTQY